MSVSCMYSCHGLCVEVRGQLSGVFSVVVIPSWWSRIPLLCVAMYSQLASLCASGHSANSHLEVVVLGLQMVYHPTWHYEAISLFTFLFVCVSSSITMYTWRSDHFSPSNMQVLRKNLGPQAWQQPHIYSWRLILATSGFLKHEAWVLWCFQDKCFCWPSHLLSGSLGIVSDSLGGVPECVPTP